LDRFLQLKHGLVGVTVMGITITGIITVMEAVLVRMGWRWEWDCWVMASAITATGRLLIRPPMAIPPSAMPRVTHTRPRSRRPLLRPYISSNGIADLITNCFLPPMLQLDISILIRRELK
jgi:hypothetical protein